MSKQFSKEELEHDPLLDFYTRAVNFFNENKAPILSVIVTVLVVIAVSIGYNYYSENQEAKAQDLLAIAEVSYSLGEYEEALQGDEYELTYGFAYIADKFSGTNAGNLASYYAAVSNFKMGNYEDALAYMNNFKPTEGIMGVSGISFHASLLVANSMLNEGAKMYIKAANWDTNNTTTPYNLFKAAQVFHEMGNTERAMELTDQIISDYPESPEFTESQRLQGMLTVSS